MQLTIKTVRWPLKTPFTIARETIHDLPCIWVEFRDGDHVGRAESVGVDYHGETPETITAQIEEVRHAIEAGLDRTSLQSLLPHGGARQAIDCALWDLAAKKSGVPVWKAAGLSEIRPVHTALTFGMMGEAQLRSEAKAAAGYRFLKVKTDGVHGLDPIRVVHEMAPNAKLIVDANEGWSAADLERYAPHFEGLGVALLEQPISHRDDEALRGLSLPVPVAADEAFNTSADITGLVGKYQALNIKLDKTGGLTEALKSAKLGNELGFRLMVGCMVGSSLSMAPAHIIAQMCDFVDLDGPLLQAADCDHPIVYQQGCMGIPEAALWG
jgi:L-Ala-D/L-Glu epimerase